MLMICLKNRKEIEKVEYMRITTLVYGINNKIHLHMKHISIIFFTIMLFLNCSYGQVKNEELEVFKKDELTLLLKVNFYAFLNNLVKEDIKATNTTILEGNSIVEKLNTKFGKEKVTIYLDILDKNESSAPMNDQINKIFGTHDGSACTLNLDGTTYWDACSFWDGVAAYGAMLLNCGSVDFGSGESEWIYYAKCNQRQICKHC